MIRVLLLFCSVLAFGDSFGAAIQIERFAPLGLIPGTNTTVTFFGSGLSEATDLWTSFGGSAHKLTNANSGQVSFQIYCPAGACGIGAMQVIGPHGISDYQLVSADPLPAILNQDDNHSPRKAIVLKPPCAVEAIALKDSVDYYKVHGENGELFSIEIYAHRLGREMDSVVQVLDTRGKEVAFADDEGGTSKDSRFQFKCPSAGDYLLAVHDVGFEGGKDYNYRLRIGSFPLVWFTYPLEPGKNDPLEFYGLGIHDPGEICSFSSQEGLTNLFENEPNNFAPQARPFQFPARLNGKFQYSGDVDLYKFPALKGQTIVFHGATRSLGSPADIVLKIKKEDGTLVNESDLSGAQEGTLTNVMAENGTFLAEITELSGIAGADLPYLITASSEPAGFDLSCETDKIEVQKGGHAVLKITCARFGFEGPVSLDLGEPMEGIRLENNSLPEKKTEAEIKFRALDSANPASFQHFRIRGKALIHGKEVIVETSTAPALKKTFPLMIYPVPFLDGLFSLAVTE